MAAWHGPTPLISNIASRHSMEKAAPSPGVPEFLADVRRVLEHVYLIDKPAVRPSTAMSKVRPRAGARRFR